MIMLILFMVGMDYHQHMIIVQVLVYKNLQKIHKALIEMLHL